MNRTQHTSLSLTEGSPAPVHASSRDCATRATRASRSSRSSWKNLGTTLALAAALGISSIAFGVDLRFKSGGSWRGEINDTVELVFVQGGREQTIEGKVLRADNTMVQLEVMVGGKPVKRTIVALDIKSMKTLSAATTEGTTPPATTPTTPAKDAAAGATTTATEKAAAPGKPKVDAKDYKGVFYMPIEGMVGIGMRHDEIEAIGKEADKYGPGQIIIIEIDSPGGLVLEAERIHTTMLELKKRHRVVAWIKEAISAAAFTALHCDEIYFMSVGALGSMTMFSGTTAAQGAELEGWLDLAARVAREGGRNGHLAKCMIKVELELSYDIPEGGGPKDAIFREDAKGKYVLDRADTMLTLNAAQALACGFSDGTADTPEELAVLMGLPEWKEVNDVGRKIFRDWQRMIKDGPEEIIKLVAQLSYKNTSGGAEKAIATQIRIVGELIKWWDRCWSCMFDAQQKGVGVPPKEYLEEVLKDLRKQLAEIKAQNREMERGR